jgi:hypothetical protein
LRGKVRRIVIKVPFLDSDNNEAIEISSPIWRLKPSSFLLSILVHAGIVCLMIVGPSRITEDRLQLDPSEMEKIAAKKKPLVYWVRIPAALPQISPQQTIGDRPEYRAQEQSRSEKIIVQQPNADAAKQLVWQPEKLERLKTEVPLENMVAIQGKAVPKPFEAPKVQAPVAESPKPLAPPPSFADNAKFSPAIDVTAPAALPKPKPKAFIPPKEEAKRINPSLALAEAPPEIAVTANTGLGGAGMISPLKKLAPNVPRSQRASDSGLKKVIEEPPPVTAGGTGSMVTAAVIGLNPANKMPVLPEGSRPAAFSRAAEVGSPAGGSPGKGTTIPGVAAAGSVSGTTSAVIPINPGPVAVSGRMYEYKVPASASSTSAPLRPSSRMLPRNIEAFFKDRLVYTIVVPKPNLPQYTADWAMWFSEPKSEASNAAAMRAPMPIRRVSRGEDSKVSSTPAEGYVHVSGVIGKDGKLHSIAPLHGRYPLVAAKAAEDLVQWEFRPAWRNGEPVEVEVVIELPFRIL